MNKLPIKDILAAIDMNGKSVWKELTDEERKQVSFWLLNRYISAVQGSRDKWSPVSQTNEYYNKHYMDVSSIPTIMAIAVQSETQANRISSG